MKHAFILVLLPALTLLGGCSKKAHLTVVNRSTAEVTNVVVAGNGFFQPLGSIHAGEHRTVDVHLRGESALQFAFDADNKHFTSAPECYVEPRYKVTATVAPDFTVTADETR